MNLHLDGRTIRIPRPITIEYMLKLDGPSLKNLSHSNKEFRDFCQRTDVWKRMVMRDFQSDYDSMPVYLNEPDWMRVYFWFNRRNLVQSRLNLNNDEVIYDDDVRYDRGNSIFFNLDDIGATKFNSIIGAILNLADTSDCSDICLGGCYLDEHYFTIIYEDGANYITVASVLLQSSKLYDQLTTDIKTLILMTVPKNFGIRPCKNKSKAPPYHDDMDELFAQNVPNYAYNDPYSHLYVPHLTINESRATGNTNTDYIIDNLLHLEPFLIQTPAEYDVKQFFASILDIEYALETNYIRHSLFGVYHGTPFLLYFHEYEEKLYVLCPTKNPDPLLAKIRSFL